jgi:putative transposase
MLNKINKTKMHDRKTTRLKGYDYSQAGLYFITICTKDKKCFFGKIIDKTMILNDVGNIAYNYLMEIPKHFPGVKIDAYIIMPNHVHLILNLGRRRGDITCRSDITCDVPTICDNPHQNRRDMTCHVPTMRDSPNHDHRDMTCRVPTTDARMNKFSNPVSGSVSVIIQQYKSSVKRWVNKNNHKYFQWQSRFNDRIIRDDQSYRNTCNYIVNNPAKWNNDKFFRK